MTFLCGFPVMGTNAPKVANRARESEGDSLPQVTTAQLLASIYNLGCRRSETSTFVGPTYEA